MARLLNTVELAEQLQLHPETIRRMAREKTIPVVRFCRVLRFDPEAVEAAIRSNVAAASGSGGDRGSSTELQSA
jgi:excisionase family DNA binding protein